MRKILSLGMLLVGLSFVSFAQENTSLPPAKSKVLKGKVRKHNGIHRGQQQSIEQIAKQRTAHLDKKVSLTENQRKEVYDLQLKNAQARKEMQEERRELNKRHANKSKAASQELKSVLTPDQQNILAENRAKHIRKSDDSKGRVKAERKVRRDKVGS